jgi:hypothetical protein
MNTTYKIPVEWQSLAIQVLNYYVNNYSYRASKSFNPDGIHAMFGYKPPHSIKCKRTGAGNYIVRWSKRCG